MDGGIAEEAAPAESGEFDEKGSGDDVDLEGVEEFEGREDEPPLTRFAANQLATAHWYDLSAARRDLGYVPRVSTAEGLERLKQHFLGTGEAAA